MRVNVVGNSVHDLDWDLQLFPDNINALHDSLAERIVNVKNYRSLRLNACRCSQLLDAGDRIADKRCRRRKVSENLGEALLGDLRRGGNIDQKRYFGRFRRLRDRNCAPGIVSADEKRATVPDQALSDDTAIFRFGFCISVDELDWRPPVFLRVVSRRIRFPFASAVP